VIDAAVLVAMHCSAEFFRDVPQRIAHPVAPCVTKTIRTQAGSQAVRTPVTGYF
jgi:hypothetical protein